MKHLPLAGKTALITGASRGLGVEIARHFFAAGATLILGGRDASALAEVGRECSDATREARLIPVDLADAGSVERLVAQCRDGGLVEVVVNNAAIQGPIGAFSAVDFAAWQAVFQVDFFAPARICQGLIEPMRRAGRGKIINLSGGGATSPRPHVSAYGVSKCALVRFSETLAVELKGSGIDVNCVAPGAMNTQMLKQVIDAGPGGASAEYDKALVQQRGGGALPAKAAELITFLASPAGDGISGRLISAVWDPWPGLPEHRDELAASDIYTLRRIVPEDRGGKW